MTDGDLYIRKGRLLDIKEVDKKLYNLLSFRGKLEVLYNNFRNKYIPRENVDKIKHGLESSKYL